MPRTALIVELGLLIAVTPKGVEHYARLDEEEFYDLLLIAVTPKGVEHANLCDRIVVAGNTADRRDAERR